MSARDLAALRRACRAEWTTLLLDGTLLRLHLSPGWGAAAPRCFTRALHTVPEFLGVAMKLLIADGQEMVRRGMRRILESQPDMEAVGEAADGGPARGRLAGQRGAAAGQLSPRRRGCGGWVAVSVPCVGRSRALWEAGRGIVPAQVGGGRATVIVPCVGRSRAFGRRAAVIVFGVRCPRGGESGGDVAPRLARALVVAVAAALASAHLLKGLGRIPTAPVTGGAIAAACLALVVLQLRHTRSTPARGRGPGWAVAELAVAFLAVGPLGVSVGLLCLPAASLLLERRRLLLALFGTGAVLVEALRSASIRDAVDLLLTVALGGVMLYAVTTLALLATRVHAARLTLAAAAVTDERLRIASSLRSELSQGLAEIHGLAVRQDRRPLTG